VSHPDVRVRREAVRSLGRLRNEATSKVLLSAVDDTDLDVRLLAIRGLGTAETRVGVPRLRELLRVPNRTGNRTELIRAAAIALGRIGASEALADLRVVARRPWLFRSRRISAYDAAVWAVSTLQGEMTGEAPEARMRTRQSTDASADADDRCNDEATDSADA
jgi:HEAT repeat protein